MPRSFHQAENGVLVHNQSSDDRARTTRLVQARFQRPQFGNDTIARPRLFALLSELRRLTLVSAPDGYGKTVLVSTWLESLGAPYTWLTLDVSHSDPNRFATDFLAAVHVLAPDVGRESHALSVTSTSPSTGKLSAITDYVLEEMAGIQRQMIVILDDYDEIQGNETHEIVHELVWRLPRDFHLILITRRDPPFSLASLRAYGLLMEVRTNALRFKPTETTAFLQQVLPMPSDEEAATYLQQKTEGWIAGLHLMTLHLRGLASLDARVERMRDSDRYAVEYLAIEVLQRQSPAMQQFLITTSILDAFCASLCAAVTDDPNPLRATHNLDSLRANNLFVVELGNQRGWYRYQNLFRQVLLDQLAVRMAPHQVADLHTRASTWYAGEGMVEAAIIHAKAAGDATTAVDLLAKRRHDLMNREEWRTLRHLLDLFDRAMIEAYPDLLLVQAWLALSEGRVVQCTPLLDRIDRLLAAAPDQATVASLRAEADIVRAEVLFVSMRPHDAIAVAQSVVPQIAPEWQTAGSHLIFSLAGAHQATGSLSQAYTILNQALNRPGAYSSVFQVRILAAQSLIQWVAADLPAMLRTSVQMQTMAEQLHLVEMRSWANCYTGLIYYQWGELDRAERVLQLVTRQPSAVSSLAYANAVCTLALTYQAMGRSADANTLLRTAIDFLGSVDCVALPILHALAAELALRQGDMGTAAQWAISQSINVPQMPALYCLEPMLTKPKVLLALNQANARKEAYTLLSVAQEHYASSHNTRFQIETLILLAGLYQAEKRGADALATLEAALLMAQPGGLVRVFVDSGANLLPLFHALGEHQVAPTLVGQICAAIQSEQQPANLPGANRTTQPGASVVSVSERPNDINSHGLLEPLTRREVDVLALMARRMTNQEIARSLDISAHTVKQHVGNIFGKLQVADRRQAIARAIELGVLLSSQRPL